MPPLLTSWDLARSCGEPHTIIRVSNLSTTLPVAKDAWGRPSKPQPILISSSISLRQPFSSSSATDTVTNSTIHYGILSKSILKACAEFAELCGDESMPVPMHLRALLQYIHLYLTHTDTLPKYLNTSRMERDSEPVLKCAAMKMLEIEIVLPKASLLGSGISLKGAFAYDPKEKGPIAYSMTLGLKELRVPALIGVNSNERLAKQMIVATIEMDRWDRMVDAYCELEELITKTIEESSFQTLEALASHLGSRIIEYFLLPYLQASRRSSAGATFNYQKIRIRLEKPTAVTFADAPAVEMLVDSDPEESPLAKELHMGPARAPPFPLQGSLSDWITKNKA